MNPPNASLSARFATGQRKRADLAVRPLGSRCVTINPADGGDDRGKVRLSMKAVDQTTGEDLEAKQGGDQAPAAE